MMVKLPYYYCSIAVDHNILLSVLHDRFSVEDTAYDWFDLYLSYHYQSFVHCDQQIIFCLLDCNVSQGLVLGLLEFIAYAEESSNMVAKHDINQHAHTSDNQLHTICFLSDITGAS